MLGVEVTLNFAQDIVRRYSQGDTAVIRYIDQLEIFVVPFINPEGHIVVESGQLIWRKNKSDNDNNGIFNFHDGVDNNRNYDFGWAIDSDPGALVPESLMYRGTAPFTESENRAMAAFAWKYRPVVALDYHSPTYGRSEVAYYPWYWYSNVGGHGESPDASMMMQICRDFCSRIINDAGDASYEARRALVDKGDFKTYFYGNFGSVAFSVEVSDTTIQNPAMVDGIVARNLPGQYYLLQRALGPSVTGIIRDSVTLEPIEAEVQVLERINADINPRLSRPDFGRYNRILAAGSYTLKFLKSGYRDKTVTNVHVGSSGPTTVDVLLFPTNPRPPAPLLTYPVAGDTVTSRTFQFDWGDPIYATKYYLQMATDTLFLAPLIAESTITHSNFSLETPLTDGHYYWRVRAGNTNGWGPFSLISDFFVFEVSGIKDHNLLPSEFKLYQCYPNPFNQSTLISFDLPVESRVIFQIFNITGALVANPALARMSAGHHSLIWSGRDEEGNSLASGIYFYRLEANQFTYIKSMTLIK